MFPLNKNTTDGTDKFVTTYYVRDPQGNVLAVYERKRGETGNGTLTLAEQHLYGASRLGMTKPNLVLSGTSTGSADPTAPAVHYELTNHLGNGLSVIIPDASDATQPAIESLTDYYPFGMEEPGRSYNVYRYGFNGKETVFDDSQDYGERIYKLSIARFLSADPLIIYNQKYPELSPYQFASNTPILAIDLDGLEAYISSYGTSKKGSDIEQFKGEAIKDPIVKEMMLKDPSRAAVISAGNLDEFSKQLDNYSKEKNGIAYLSISSHAAPYSILTGYGYGTAIANFSSKNPDKYGYVYTDFKEIFKNVTFTSDALLVIAGCNTGNTINTSNPIALKMAKALKVGVIAASYSTYPNKEDGYRHVDNRYVTYKYKNGKETKYEKGNYRLFYLDEKGSLQIQDLGPALTPEIIKSAQSIIKGVNEKKQNNNVEEKNIDESN